MDTPRRTNGVFTSLMPLRSFLLWRFSKAFSHIKFLLFYLGAEERGSCLKIRREHNGVMSTPGTAFTPPAFEFCQITVLMHLAVL